MSGKRRAEKYLTDRNADEEDGDDEIQNVDDGAGFKQASDKEIAARPMRGLPGRKSTAGSPAPSSFKPSTPAPAFGSFGTTSASTATPSKPSTFAGFSFTPSASATSAAATNGTSISQTNGHVLAFSFASNSPAAAPMQKQVASASSTLASNGSSESDPEVTYFTCLRGLNASVIAPIQQLLDQDPFKDISSALEQIAKSYKEQRLKIQLKRDSGISKASAKVSGMQARNQAATPEMKAESVSTSTTMADKPKSTPFAGFAFGQTASVPAATKPAGIAASSAAPPSTSAVQKSATSAPAFSFTSSTVTPKTVEQSQPKPPAPPAAFTFAGQSFKPDANARPSVNSTSSSSSSGSTQTSAGAFVFDPSKAKGSEKSSFTFAFPTTTVANSSSESHKSDHQSRSMGSSDTSLAGKTQTVPLPSGVSPLMPANTSRARQPSPLRQVETVPETDLTKGGTTSKDSITAKPFSGFSFTTGPVSGSAAKTVPFNPPGFSNALPGTQPAVVVPTTPSKGGATLGGSASSPKGSSAFTFGTAAGAMQTSPKAFNSSVGFSFGGGASTSSSSSGGGGGGSTVPSSSATAAAVPSTFSGFSFGKPAAAAPAAAAEPGKPAPLFSWGTSASVATPSGSGVVAPAPAAAPSAFSGFSFSKPVAVASSNTPAPAVSASAFGSSSSVPAFSFVAPPTPSALAAPSSSSSASGTSTPITTPASGETATTNNTTAAAAAADEDGPPIVDPADNSLLGNGHGAGEENEETVYEVRCKLWKLEDSSSSQAKKAYVEYGINNLRIKRDKTSGKTRILCRGDANGKVNVNFAVHKALDVKVEKTFLQFLGFDQAGQPLPLRVRVKTLDGANQLKQEIDAVVPR